MRGLKILFWGFFVWLGAGQVRPGVPAVFLYTETPRYDASRADRFPLGASLAVVENGRRRMLVPGFAASADAAVSFDGRRVLFSGRQRSQDAWQIWEVALSGGSPRRITWFAEDAITPFYVTDDRIVCARRTAGGFQLEIVPMAARYTERITFGPGDHIASGVLRDGRILFEAPHAGSAGRDVYTVYADGSGVETIRCDHGRDRHAAAEAASGDIVFETGGRLARFTSARAVQVDLGAPAGEFAGPIAEAAVGEWWAAFRAVERQPFGIYCWRPGKGAPEKVWAANGAQAVQPAMVRPHDPPKRHPTALGDREGANLLCLNAYTSRSRMPAGTVTAVRVWTLDDGGKAVALGQAAVERDGSFFVQAPADRAIRFELLDGAGKTIAGEKGWFWARRGEQRVCVGCHAGPERAPENAVPAVLLRSTEPARMTLPVQSARGAK
jgi:hypothetical protein